MKSCLTFSEGWNGVQISCSHPESRQCFALLHSPLWVAANQTGSVRRPCSGGPAAQRYITVRITLWHVPPKKGLPERWAVWFPSSHLGTNQVGLEGWGSHSLHILELCEFQAHPGKDSNAWAKRANKSSNSLMFINPLGNFLSCVHNKSYREKPGRGQLLWEWLLFKMPSAASSVVNQPDIHPKHDCFSSLGIWLLAEPK